MISDLPRLRCIELVLTAAVADDVDTNKFSSLVHPALQLFRGGVEVNIIFFARDTCVFKNLEKNTDVLRYCREFDNSVFYAGKIC